MLTDRSKLIWVYFLSGLFIMINIFLILKNFYWVSLVPVGLIVLLLYFISIDKVILLITLLTPVAVNIRDIDMGVGISLPTEPLMFGVLVFFMIRILYDGSYDIRILKQPLSILILINLVWILFTSITSELPVVSFKYLLARLWFVVPFYFFAILVFKKLNHIRAFIWLYIIPFTGIIFYTISRHVHFGLDESSGHWVMRPFYNDHTAYGAILTMYIPFLFGFSFNRKYSINTRIFSFVFLVIFLVALVLSYSRAAWLSLAVATVVYLLVLLRIKFRWILITGVIILGLFFSFQNQILDKLERNKQDSSANFIEHVQSITNITSDASNLERINRWQSALRMFTERPFWGWGPGTYQFLYAPYQRSKEKTIISTNLGDMGNAHSEYISPLAESGVLGMLIMLSIAMVAVYSGLRTYQKSKNYEVRMISLAATIGLVSYFVHGFLNNFLDSDKASVPVWGFMAILIALYLYHNQYNNAVQKNVLHENKITK